MSHWERPTDLPVSDQAAAFLIRFSILANKNLKIFLE